MAFPFRRVLVPFCDGHPQDWATGVDTRGGDLEGTKEAEGKSKSQAPPAAVGNCSWGVVHKLHYTLDSEEGSRTVWGHWQPEGSGEGLAVTLSHLVLTWCQGTTVPQWAVV